MVYSSGWAIVPRNLMELIFMRAGPLVVAGTLISAWDAFAAEPIAPNDIQATFFNGKPLTALDATKSRL